MTSIIRLQILGLGLSSIVFSACVQDAKTNALVPREPERKQQVALKPETAKKPYDFLFSKNLGQGFSDPFSGKKTDGFFHFNNRKNRIRYINSQNENAITESWILPPGTDSIPVKSMMAGVVTGIDEHTITMQHCFLENGKKKSLHFRYQNIRPADLEKGKFYPAATEIGLLNSNELKIVNEKQDDDNPCFFREASWYAREYHKLTFPPNEEHLLVVIKSSYRIFYFNKGALQKEFDVCLGQEPLGHKQKEGDNKTPEGEYRITEKEKGPFTGGTGPWLGDRWMHFSYPNRYDAYEGYLRGLITEKQYLDIESTDKNKGKTNSYTKLGGRIGLHGWNGEFIANGSQNLTWGCVCMQNNAITELFDLIPMDTKLIILP